MTKKLLIVESPAKAKTINKYLGNNFIVLASFGHVRDLPKKNGSIDITHDFTPKYQLIERNKKHVADIIAKSKNCDEIILATDPDREGEAIAWHIADILQHDKKLADASLKLSRVVFHEITATAIKKAVANPRELDLNLVAAQQARLTLDYLIGFNISPLLWRKVKSGLSAGRVQSPALRLICEREAEIKAFVPEDYFSIILNTHKEQIKFNAKLIRYANDKIDTKTIKTKEEADKICQALNGITPAIVSEINQKQKKKNPPAPFITSSLQIEAARKLGFFTDKTMKVAQSLYEGVELDSGSVGLITYMRTDSVHLADIAVTEIRDYIKQNYSKEYLPSKAVQYVSKVKNAQEAHEAIRPTVISYTPENIKKYLTTDQYKLYQLIWQRTVACQLNPAILDTTAIDISLAKAVFRANGIVVNFDGFMKVYQETNEEQEVDDEESKLPHLTVDEKLAVDKIDCLQHQTEPKPRYSEAALVKALEELGIGRPSTYATIISTLKKREYVTMDKKKFIPTDIGDVVSQFLTKHMTKYVDYQFTAHLEDTLDDISNGITQKLPVLKDFWQNLSTAISDKQNIDRDTLTSEKLDENCPECGKQLITRLGKYGKFIGCSGYPQCRYMRKIDKDGNSVAVAEPEVVEGRTCPKDNGVLVIRSGRYGKFISCKNYPKCKYIENIEGANANGKSAISDNPEQTNAENTLPAITCPECHKGQIVSKRNRYGNIFYACNNYPECKTLFNSPVIAQSCPVCNYPVMLHKVTKTRGEETICANPECKHKLAQ